MLFSWNHFITLVAVLCWLTVPATSTAQDRPARTEDTSRGKQAQDAAARTQRDAEREGRQRREDVEGAADSTAQEAGQRGERAGARADSTARTVRNRGEDNAGRLDSTRTTRVDRMTMLADRMESARQREQERHQRRLARIEEIRTVAKEQNDTEALARVELLVEKEAEVHTKKIQQLADLERRMARLRDGGEGAERPEREARGQRDSTRSDNR
ncbi:MAG: hypothetical protein SH809_06945 [Rhodothermales bacterium]|nr:hypothetical protein [Rhodothermales bacterium]